MRVCEYASLGAASVLASRIGGMARTMGLIQGIIITTTTTTDLCSGIRGAGQLSQENQHCPVLADLLAALR